MRRADRYGDEVYRILADVIYKKINDPRIAGIASLTGVEVSNDLTVARIFYSVYGSDEDREKAREAFEKAAGFLHQELAARMRSKKSAAFSVCGGYESALRRIDRSTPKDG